MRTKSEIGSSDWFGEIPDGWGMKPAKALFTTTKGMTVTKADLVEDGAPVVNYGQVHSKANSGFHLSDELVRYVPEDFVKVGLRKSTFGSFIFACTSEDMEGCGACVYNDGDIEVNPGGDTMLLSPKRNGDNRFYAYLFSTDEWRWQFRRNLVDVKVFHVNQTDLKETYLVVPPPARRAAAHRRLPGREVRGHRRRRNPPARASGEAQGISQVRHRPRRHARTGRERAHEGLRRRVDWRDPRGVGDQAIEIRCQERK